MLYYAMLCYAMLCYAMLCYAIVYYNEICYIKFNNNCIVILTNFNHYCIFSHSHIGNNGLNFMYFNMLTMKRKPPTRYSSPCMLV